MGLKKRPPPPGGGMAVSDPWEDPDFKSDFPALYAFLFDAKYEDGSSRLQGTISIFVTGYALKIAVNDKDRNIVAFVTAGTWSEALTLVDDGIAADSLEWKASTKTIPGKNPPF
jgi:hypothetical protein